MAAWYEIYRDKETGEIIGPVSGCCWGCAEGEAGEGHFLCFRNRYQDNPRYELLWRGYTERWQAEEIADEYEKGR